MDGRPGSGGPSNPRMGGLPSTDTPSLARSKKLGGCLLFGLARRRPRLTTTRTNRRHTPLGSVCVRVGAGRHRHRLGMTMSSQERRPAVLRALAGSQEDTRPARDSSDGALVDGSERLVREGREALRSSCLPLTAPLVCRLVAPVAPARHRQPPVQERGGRHPVFNPPMTIPENTPRHSE